MLVIPDKPTLPDLKSRNLNLQSLCKGLILWMAFLLVPISSLNAQFNVSGKVEASNTGEPLIGANVVVKGTTTGTTTDVSGKYSLRVEDANAILVFSYVGYLAEELPLNGQSVINVALVMDLATLDEIIVIGYGTLKKSSVTGAVSSINADDIASTKVPNAVQSIQGKAAGVDIVRGSGRAGSGYNVLIRGASTLSGSTDPLYIVDGVYYDELLDVNSNDIESIDILKDASATAIYGPRGANGVIIVTTKKGNAGKAVVTFNSFGGTTSPLGDIPFMNRNQYINYLVDADWIKKWKTNPSVTRDQADTSWIFGTRPWELYGFVHGTDFDWRDAALRKGSQQDYNLGFSGGNERVTYAASFSHYNEKGLLKTDNYKRYSVKANLEAKMTDNIKGGVNTIITYNINENGQYQDGGTLSPLCAPYDSSGNLVVKPKSPGEDFPNPLIYQNRDYYMNEKRNAKIFNTAFLEVRFLKDFTFRTSFNATITSQRAGTFSGSYPGIGGTSSANSVLDNSLQWVWLNLLTGARQFGDHNVQFTLGSETYSNRFESYGISVTDLALNNGQFFALAGAAGDMIPTSDLTIQNRVAFLTRVNYAFKDKYLLAGTLRYDGASQLAAGHKWHMFPSFSLGWNVHNESFMEAITVISQLKLRGGWGISGKENVDPYSTLGLLTANPLYYEFGLTETPALGFRAENAPNPSLEWEKTEGWNFGLDMGILGNRIQGVVDLYINRTYDLLQTVSLAPSSGILNQTDNVGSIKNKGIELTLKSTNLNTPDFSWSTDLTFYANHEEIIELSSGRTKDELNGWFVGQPVQAYYDRKVMGVWQFADTVGLSSYALYGAHPGDVRYYDYNNDTAITDIDRVIIGTQRPKWTGGLTNRFRYKNWDLSIFIFARIGQTIQDGVRSWGVFGNARETPMALDYWTPENPSNEWPSPTYITNRSGNAELGYLSYVNGSYVKIRDITLGYNVPKSLLDKLKLSRMRVYITAQNAFCFGEYFHRDSDSVWKGNRNDPELNGSMGLPAPKMYGAGINVTF